VDRTVSDRAILMHLFEGIYKKPIITETIRAKKGFTSQGKDRAKFQTSHLAQYPQAFVPIFR